MLSNAQLSLTQHHWHTSACRLLPISAHPLVRSGNNCKDQCSTAPLSQTTLLTSPAAACRHAPQYSSRLCRASPNAQLPASPLPASQQEAVDDAVQCASVRLKPRLQAGKAPTKGFASAAATPARENLHVEIPTADQSPAALAQLAVEMAAALVSSLGNASCPMLMVCADPAVAQAAGSLRGRPPGCRVLELREACRSPRLEGGLLLVIAPATSDVALCQQLTDETWTGRGTVLVNAEFLTVPPASLGMPSPLTDYMEQVVTVYALMPVAVKGLLGSLEGVVLRQATGKGGDSANMWRILMKAPGKDEQFLQIGQTKRRPSTDDLQLIFINANASSSPLTKLVSRFKGKK